MEVIENMNISGQLFVYIYIYGGGGGGEVAEEGDRTGWRHGQTCVSRVHTHACVCVPRQR